MIEFDTISTETWRVRLPNDWSENNDSRNRIYFESADGSKGAYVSTWRFDDDPRSAAEILESFRRVEVNSFSKMENHTWEAVDEWAASGADLTIMGVDYLDRGHSYRIVCYLLASLPWVVRWSFHDYDCSDYDASKEFFGPIIDSATIHHEVA